jgi:hypothetical protein
MTAETEIKETPINSETEEDTPPQPTLSNEELEKLKVVDNKFVYTD